jgi:tetratricopeptide (TPR) repeat protein
LHPRLAQAHTLHRAGRLAEAKRLCEIVLAKRPSDPHALRLLAELHCQTGMFQKAEPLLRRLTAAQPDVAEFHFNLAAVNDALDRPDIAVEAYSQAITRKPDFVDAYFGRGNALAARGRLNDALVDFDKVIALRPDDDGAHTNRGSILRALGRFEDALAALDRSLSLRPQFAEALNNRGGILRDLGRLEEAVDCFDRALTVRPAFPEALLNRGNALSGLGRHEEALTSYDAALFLNPSYAAAHYDRGNALLALKRFDGAVASYDSALAHRADHVEALNNRGIALLALQRREALADFDKVLRLQPDHAEAWNNRGNALQAAGRAAEALDSYDRAIAGHPQYFDPVKNKSYALLRMGLFEQGWRLYEARKRSSDPVGHQHFTQPPWLGETDIAGKTILVHWEQGFGDTLQFCRYVLDLNRLGAHVLLAPQMALRRLMGTLGAPCDVVDPNDPMLVFDVHSPLLSLPLACKTTVDTIPAHVPYLAADPERVETWGRVLGDGAYRIGICWQGNRQSPADPGRSFSAALFRGLSQIPGVRLISLQKGDGEAELGSLPPDITIETLGETFDDGPDAFLDTAAVMQHLDLVISSDTAVAHLAGALGRPVWLAVKHVPDWRWLTGRTDSPWYPTMRLFRQPSAGDWHSVFADIERALRHVLDGRSGA